MADNTITPPTIDEAFGAPSIEDAFGPEQKKQSFGGQVWDWAFTQPAHQLSQSLKLFGQDIKQGWGSEPLGMSEESQKSLGIYHGLQDFKDGRGNLIKAANETWMRGSSIIADTALRTMGTAAHVVESSLAKHPLLPDKMAREAAGMVEWATTTGVPELSIFHPTIPNALNRARAEGAIGESEGSYFGTKPQTPEEFQGRQEASAHAAQAPQAKAAAIAEPVLVPKPINERIAQDVSAKLQQAGRPKEEADAAGQLISSHYEARADRFESKLGTAEELYTKDFPKIKIGGTPGIAPEASFSSALEGSSTLDQEIKPQNDNVSNITNIEREQRLTPDTDPNKAYEDYFDEIYDKYADKSEFRLDSFSEFLESASEKEKQKLLDLHTRAKEYNKLQEELPSIEFGNTEAHGGKFPYGQIPYDVKSFNNDELFQNKRGSLTITPEGQKNILRLFKDADASTFIHENGHQWLEELINDASHPEAPIEVKNDFETIKNYLNWREDQSALTRKQHEKFARSFERYIMEGKAPNEQLATVFQKFKQWLTQIYQTIKNLRVPINDEVRKIFDRLTASDRMIEIEPEIRLGEEASHEITAPKAEAQSDSVIPKTPQEEKTFNQKTRQYVDKAGNINLDLISSDQALKDTVREIIEHNDDLYPARQGVVTHDLRLRMAESLAINPKDVDVVLEHLNTISGKDTYTPLSASMQAVRIVMEQNARAVQSAQLAGNLEDFAIAKERLLRTAETFSGVVAEWGRLGQVLQMEGAKDSLKMAEFFQSNFGKTPEELMQEMKRVGRLDSTGKIIGFIKDTEKASLGEMIQEFFVNRLISGPITHTMYLAGQELFTVYRSLENVLQAGISKVHNAISPAEDARQLTYFGEAKQDLFALTSGHINGLRAAGKAFIEGQTQLLPGEEVSGTPFQGQKAVPNLLEFKIPEGIPLIGGKTASALPLGAINRIPSERMVAPIHSLNRTVAFTVARDRLIYKQAASEGLTGNLLHERIAELQVNTPVDITVQARADASEASLMGKPGDWTRKGIAFLHHKFVFPVLGRTAPLAFLSPFISIGSNLNRLAILERSPIGAIFAKTIKADLKGDNGRLAQDAAWAKMIAGTSIGIGVGTMTAMRLMNPSGPSDYKEAAVDKMVNGLPNSIRVGEMSYAFDRLGILGTMFSMAANTGKLAHDLAETDEDHTAAQASLEYFKHIYEHFTSEGMLSGISDAMNASNDPARYGESWAQNFLSTFAIGVGPMQIAQRTDPYQRDVKGQTFSEGLMNQIKAKTPGLSEDLQEKIDLFGQPVPNREFLGVYAQKLSDDPVWQALKDTSYFPAPVKRTINGVHLTNEQYHEYASRAGYLAHMILSQEVNQSWYNNLDEKTRHELIKSAFEKSRRIAASVTKANNVDIIQKAVKAKANLAEGTE